MGINNLEKLLDSISAEDVSDDYWYDIGVIEVQNILEKLSEEEWEMLRRIIKSKSEEWQKKLIYGFDEVGNEQEITIIMDLIDTNNCELFEICIDSKRPSFWGQRLGGQWDSNKCPAADIEMNDEPFIV